MGVNAFDTKFGQLYQLEQALGTQTTPPADDKADAEVNLADKDGNVMKLGPTMLTGRAVETTRRPGWARTAAGRSTRCSARQPTASTCSTTGGPLCNSGAAQCLAATASPGASPSCWTPRCCRRRRSTTHLRPGLDLDLGAFDEDEAKSLAVALRFGSLPIELQAQQAETVSATLGAGALQAGIIAGAIGLFLVCAYLVSYYRLLGLATVGSLTISASILWVVMCWINATVTLAGVVGIVVSIGISLDSSIVFFGRSRKTCATGRLETVGRQGVRRNHSTIVKADMSSLIGAGVPYWLSVGPVRGFAFYLGVATILDLISAYVFLRPAALVLGPLPTTVSTRGASGSPPTTWRPPSRARAESEPVPVAASGRGQHRPETPHRPEGGPDVGLASDLYRRRNDFDFPACGCGSGSSRPCSSSSRWRRCSPWPEPLDRLRGRIGVGGPVGDLHRGPGREALADFGDSAVERFQEATTTEGGRVIRVSGRVDNVAEGAKAAEALAEAAGLEGRGQGQHRRPSWERHHLAGPAVARRVHGAGDRIHAWRLETRMAVAAMVAVIHDIIITVGVYSVFQIEVTPATVISFLTILGFSLYDDRRVRPSQENATRYGRSGQYTYTSIMRRSLNQVFMRSLNTTMVTIIPVISILVVGQVVFGQETLGDFSLALLIGLVSGTCSSLFVARRSPRGSRRTGPLASDPRTPGRQGSMSRHDLARRERRCPPPRRPASPPVRAARPPALPPDRPARRRRRSRIGPPTRLVDRPGRSNCRGCRCAPAAGTRTARFPPRPPARPRRSAEPHRSGYGAPGGLGSVVVVRHDQRSTPSPAAPGRQEGPTWRRWRGVCRGGAHPASGHGGPGDRRAVPTVPLQAAHRVDHRGLPGGGGVPQDQLRRSGEPHITHPLAVAGIVARLRHGRRHHRRRSCTTPSRTRCSPSTRSEARLRS